MLEILGKKAIDLLGKNAISSLFSADERGFFAQHNQTNKVELYHTWHNRQAATKSWLKIKITNRYNPQQQFEGRLFVISEASEQKRLEDEHNRLVGELEKIKKSWADFAYIISHDLKAPLRAISTLAAWISEDYSDQVDEMGKEQLLLLNNRVQRMHDLIEGVLQYSRIGRVKKTPTTFKLRTIIDKVIADLKPTPAVHFHLPKQLPQLVADEMRIYQLFYHLLKNAIDFNDKTKKWVRIEFERKNDHLNFKITDNGIGIASKYLKEIFTIFRTLNIIKKEKNIGIGLPLVQKIVEMYGGEIRLDAEVEKGTSVYFTLPLDMEKP